MSSAACLAPANEGLQVCWPGSNFDTGQQGWLNAEGINLLRHFEGRNLRVWVYLVSMTPNGAMCRCGACSTT